MVTKVRKLSSFDELQSLFDPEVHDDLRRLVAGAKWIVVYENLNLSSPWCGARSALKVGPSCSVPTLEEALKGHLYDLPSQRQYPVAYWEVTEEVN
jgi:hypothetical protein